MAASLPMTPSPDMPDDIQQALELFRAQFAQQLPARLDEARACWQAWREAPADDERLRALHRVLHRLAGSAGTFGQPDFGAACRTIELHLDELLERPARTAADCEAVERELAALPAAVAQG